MSILYFFVPISFMFLNINNDKYFLLLKFRKKIKNINNKIQNKCPKFYHVFLYLLMIPWVSKFVLSILLFYFIEKGDIEKYSSFLDCKRVKKKFFEKFTDIEKLREIFKAFAYLNLISEVIDKLLDFVELFIENAENEKKEKEEKEKKNKGINEYVSDSIIRNIGLNN